MDLQVSDQQRMMLDTARDWLSAHWDIDTAGRYLESDEPLPIAEWRGAADLGWLGLSISEANGGLGGELIDVVLLQEELGRALFPSTIASSLLLARILDRHVHALPMAQGWLSRLVAGEAVGTVASVEEDGRFLADTVRSEVIERDGRQYLRGTKRFVRDADGADVMAVLAMHGSSTASRRLTWVLVERRSAGVTCTLQRSSGHDRQYVVHFQDVEVAPGATLAQTISHSVVDDFRRDAMLLECGYLVGVAAQAHAMTVKHAAERVQFGRPIGSFQAIQHKVADMTTDLESSRLITYYAASRADRSTGLEDATYAKFWVSEAVQRIVREAHQIHGGLGFITEYPLFRYFRRAKTGELMFGGPHELLTSIGDSVLGDGRRAGAAS